MTLEVGIVGGGIRGRLFAEALANRDDTRIAGVADPVAGKLEWAGAIPKFSDHDDLLADAQVDALIVATPDFAHVPAVRTAARRGIPMLIEKPLTTDLAEAEELVEACGDLPVMVGFENRWNPLVRATHGAITTSGPVQWQTLELSNTTEVPLEMLSWASKSSPAWFLLPHTVDLAVWTAGEHVVSVDATKGEGTLKAMGIDTTDWIQALLKFESGASAQVTSSWILPGGNQPIVEFRYAANSPSAAVRVDVIRGDSDFAGPDGRRPLTVEAITRDGDELSAPAAMAHEFVDSLLAGEPLQPGVEHGAEITRIIAAVLRSAELREPVAL